MVRNHLEEGVGMTCLELLVRGVEDECMKLGLIKDEDGTKHTSKDVELYERVRRSICNPLFFPARRSYSTCTLSYRCDDGMQF